MKSKMKIKMKIAGKLWGLSAILLFVSCAKGFDNNETFSGGVTNTQFESPENISFSTLTNADGSESLKLTWPVVMGAGGFKVNVYNMNDPVNPAAVVADSIVDGSSMVFPKLEDTNYQVTVQTMGNEKLNNKDAQTATTQDYKAFAAVATIHESDEIAAYVNAHIQDFSQDQEQCFVLEPGGVYTLDDIADFKLNTVTFRGDKDNRPTIKVSANGGLVTQGGLKIKYINFECTDMSSQKGVLCLSENPDASITTDALGYTNDGANSGFYVINSPIIFQECNFRNIPNSLIYGNKKNYGIKDFRITNCIVQLNNEGSYSVIDFNGGGWIKDLRVENSTFYNLNTTCSGYFVRYSSSSNAQPKKTWGNTDNTGSITITYNTFCKTMANKDFANQLPNTNTLTTTVQYNIFYDCWRLYQAIQSQAKRYTDGNTIWGITKASEGNDTGGRTDSNGKPYATLEDPNFEGPIDLSFDLAQPKGGVNFKPNGSVAVGNKAGDPRWYK